jgi:hypothetical protein
VAGLRVFVPGDDPGLDSINPLGQCIDMIECLGNRGAGFGRQQIAVDLVHPLAELGNLLIPTEVARDSGMISPAIPI